MSALILAAAVIAVVAFVIIAKGTPAPTVASMLRRSETKDEAR